MPNVRLTSDIISAAIEGYEAQKATIDQKIAELRQMLGGNRPESARAASAEAPARKQRRLSAAGRKRIADAARKRWAALREAKAKAAKSAK